MNVTTENKPEAKPAAISEQRYVVGFLFNALFSRVALIRKQKPKWQSGLLNGIGGKIEEGENAMTAMRREFGEEANYPAPSELQWRRFCEMHGANNDGSAFAIDFFFCVGHPHLVASMEAEQIEVHEVCDIAGGWERTIGNLPWLVALAKDCGSGVYPPSFITAKY